MDDPYSYPGTRTLINKLDIKDTKQLSKVEIDLSFNRIKELRNNPIEGKGDYDQLKSIHKHIFQDVYDWAGKSRTIGISKKEPLLNGLSVNYPDPQNPFDNIENRAQNAFGQLAKDNNLKNLDEKNFTTKLAKHSAKIWEVHPFRDGNTRTTLTFMRHLSKSAGYDFDPKRIVDHKEIRNSFVLATAGNLKPLTTIIETGLDKSKDIENQQFQQLKDIYKNSSEKEALKKIPELQKVFLEVKKAEELLIERGIQSKEIRDDFIGKTEEIQLLKVVASSGVELTYQKELEAHLKSKQIQVERIEDRLEFLIEQQQTKLQQTQLNQPGLLSKPSTKTAWENQKNHQEARISTLEDRIERVRDEGLNGSRIDVLAANKLSKEQPDLIKKRNAIRAAQRKNKALARQVKKQQELKRTRSR